MSEERQASSEFSPHKQNPQRKKRFWRLFTGICLVIILFGGAVGLLALEQNSLLVFPDASDTFPGAPLWHYHSDSVTDRFDWLPGGNELSYDSNGGTRLNLINLATRKLSRYLSPLSASYECSSQCSATSGPSPDGRYMIEVDDEGAVPALHLRIWDLLADYQKIVDYTQDVSHVPDQGFSTAWSPDGSYLGITGGNGWLLLWHAGAGQKPFLLQAASGNFYHASWSRNNAYVAACTNTGRLEVWSVQTQKRVLDAPLGAPGTFLALSPTGTYAAVGVGRQTIQIWSVPQRMLQAGYQDLTDNSDDIGFAWSQDGRNLLSLDKNAVNQAEILRIWNALSGDMLATIPVATSGEWLLSPDSHYVATENPARDTVSIWDTQTGYMVASHSGSLSCCWSPDSKELATMRVDHAVQVWNARTGQIEYTYPGNRESVMQVSWSPDGQKLAVLTYLLTYNLFDFQHTDGIIHGSSITVWPAPR